MLIENGARFESNPKARRCSTKDVFKWHLQISVLFHYSLRIAKNPPVLLNLNHADRFLLDYEKFFRLALGKMMWNLLDSGLFLLQSPTKDNRYFNKDAI